LRLGSLDFASERWQPHRPKRCSKSFTIDRSATISALPAATEIMIRRLDFCQ
jgi:hypothetical protein